MSVFDCRCCPLLGQLDKELFEKKLAYRKIESQTGCCTEGYLNLSAQFQLYEQEGAVEAVGNYLSLLMT